MTLTGMEAVCEKAASLAAFLETPTLIDEYFAASSAYFGERKFGRESYDRILSQMKSLLSSVPELEERLWSPIKNLPSITIRGVHATYGRRIDFTEWEKFLEAWISDLASNVSKIFPDSETEEGKRTIKRNAEVIGAKIDFLIQSLPKSRRQRARAAGNIFDRLKNDPEINALASRILRTYLSSFKGRGALWTQDADVVLGHMRDLRNNPRSVVMACGFKSWNLASFVKTLIPSLSDLLKNEKIFPEIEIATQQGKKRELGRSRLAEHVFLPALRPFHMVWRGVTARDCCGGSPTYLDSTTPSRWAACAIRGSRVFYLEVNGRFEGYVHLAPVKKAGDEFWAAEFVSPIFNRRIAKNLNHGSYSLAEVFLDCFFEMNVGERIPVVLCKTSTVNNLEVIRRLSSGDGGFSSSSAGFSSEYEIADDLALRIDAAGPREGLGRNYSGSLILDLTCVAEAEVFRIAPEKTL